MRYGKESKTNQTKKATSSNLRWRKWTSEPTKATETMRSISFQVGVFLFCVFRMYYNFVEVVPQWLNDAYFVIESFLVVIFIYSSTWDKGVRLIGLLGSIGSFLYFLLRYLDIFRFDPTGAKYFVPTFISAGIIIVGFKLWRQYR